MQRVLIVAVTCSLFGCGPDGEIKKKATFACKHLLLSSQSLEAVPENVVLEEYLRNEDLEFLKKKQDGAQNGLAAAITLAMSPAVVALARARSDATVCTVGELVRDGKVAKVRVKEESPKIEMGVADGMKKIGELAKVGTDSERLEKARNLVATAAQKVVFEHEVEFVNGESGWRIVLGLPEKAKEAEIREERSASARAAVKASLQAIQTCDVAFARKKLEEAKALSAETSGWESAEEILDMNIKGSCIGGKWRREIDVDPMTDDINVAVSLSSDNQVDRRYGDSYRGQLIVRCSAKKREMFVAAEQMLDDTYHVGIVARYRFENQKAERVILSRSTSGEAGFFRNPDEWFGLMVEHENETMMLELPVYNSTPLVFRFSLAGVDKAVAALASRCAKQ